MLKEHDTYTIAEHWITAIEYDDQSGLTDAESADLSAWIDSMPPGPLHFQYGESREFARDAISGLLADCVSVTVLIQG